MYCQTESKSTLKVEISSSVNSLHQPILLTTHDLNRSQHAENEAKFPGVKFHSHQDRRWIRLQWLDGPQSRRALVLNWCQMSQTRISKRCGFEEICFSIVLFDWKKWVRTSTNLSWWRPFQVMFDSTRFLWLRSTMDTATLAGWCSITMDWRRDAYFFSARYAFQEILIVDFEGGELVCGMSLKIIGCNGTSLIFRFRRSSMMLAWTSLSLSPSELESRMAFEQVDLRYNLLNLVGKTRKLELINILNVQNEMGRQNDELQHLTSRLVHMESLIKIHCDIVYTIPKGEP